MSASGSQVPIVILFRFLFGCVSELVFLAVLQVRTILGDLDQIIIGERYVRYRPSSTSKRTLMPRRRASAISAPASPRLTLSLAQISPGVTPLSCEASSAITASTFSTFVLGSWLGISVWPHLHKRLTHRFVGVSAPALGVDAES